MWTSDFLHTKFPTELSPLCNLPQLLRQLHQLRSSKNQIKLQQHGPLLGNELRAQITYHAEVACGGYGQEGTEVKTGLLKTKYSRHREHAAFSG